MLLEGRAAAKFESSSGEGGSGAVKLVGSLGREALRGEGLGLRVEG